MTITNAEVPEGTSLPEGPVLFDVSRDQIRNRNRVRDLAEVYTHHREVTAMLDLVPDMFPTEADAGNHDSTFLELACGCGNFLVEILRRKLRTVTTSRYRTGERFEHQVLRCLASIYGIDIDQDNVLEARDRLRAVITEHVSTRANAPSLTKGFQSAVDAILNTNVIRADTLADAQKIELVAYRPERGGTFIREWSTLEEPESQFDLFAMLPGEPQRDEIPVHYADLSVNPNPTVAPRKKR